MLAFTTQDYQALRCAFLVPFVLLLPPLLCCRLAAKFAPKLGKRWLLPIINWLARRVLPRITAALARVLPRLARHVGKLIPKLTRCACSGNCRTLLCMQAACVNCLPSMAWLGSLAVCRAPAGQQYLCHICAAGVCNYGFCVQCKLAHITLRTTVHQTCVALQQQRRAREKQM